MTTIPAMFFLVLALCIAWPASARDREFALLVGVSSYRNSLEFPSLVGPRNDVALIAEALVDRGFDPSLIRTLSDAPDAYGPPSYRQILDGFDWLADTASEGDTVVVLLAGHGSVQPNDNPADDPEPDGLDEVFLPKDTGSRDELMRYKRGLVDDDIASRLDRIRAKGAFVVFIADSCRSETQNRAGARVERPLDDVKMRRYRYVSPYSELSARRLALFDDLTARARTIAGDYTVDPTQDVWTDGHGDRGSFVALFASQADEATPEEILPRGTGIDVYGLFSFHLAAALMSYRDLSWGDLLEIVRQDYRRLNMTEPTPVGDGALDKLVFGAGTRNRILQWPVLHDDGGQAFIRAGRLQNLREFAVLTLYSDPVSWSSDAIVGNAVVRNLTMTRSTLTPEVNDGAMPVGIPPNVFARTDQSSFSYALTVAVADASETLSPEERLVARALNDLLEDPGVSLDVALVPQNQSADVSLFVDGGRLWLIPASGELLRSGPAKTLSINLTGGSGGPTEFAVLELRYKMELEFVKIARAVGLAKLVELLEGADLTADIGIRIDVERGAAAPASAPKSPVVIGAPVEVYDGDSLLLTVTNTGGTAIDLTVIHVASNHDTRCVFPGPEDGELNRIEAGQPMPIPRKVVKIDTVGLEGLVFLATQAVSLTRSNLCLLANNETLRGRVSLRATLGSHLRSGTASEAQMLAGGRSVLLEVIN